MNKNKIRFEQDQEEFQFERQEEIRPTIYSQRKGNRFNQSQLEDLE